MTTPDLDALAALTRDYAAFQTRKSGLATALGGLMAVVLAVGSLSPLFMGARLGHRLLLEYLVWTPLLWLLLKGLLARALYRGAGAVKALPDGAYERRRWFWIFGLAMFLLVVGCSGLYAFTRGLLQAGAAHDARVPSPPLWLLAMPPAYLLAMPWAIRGIEEARAYAVLVGQSVLWLIPYFLFYFGAPTPPQKSGWGLFGELLGVSILVLWFLILVWGALAMVRGWKEHRDFRRLLGALPLGPG